MHANCVYNNDASSYVKRYESVAFEDVHSPLFEHIDRLEDNAFVLDIGAGSGRDAVWFATRGHEVLAVEPSRSMRNEAQRLHPGTAVQWIDDSLPSLAATHRLGVSFDFILLSAVWMHVRPADRARAMRKLATLIKPGGSIAISLRLGPPDPEREMYEVSEHELDILAREHGLRKCELPGASTADKLGRDEISWQTVLYELPDDGLGGLPLLRHIILRDDKSSTYKLALLRIVSRIADTAGGIVEVRSGQNGQDYAVVPLGLVALYWLRAFLPLVKTGLPQMPMNKAGKGLGFVKSAFNSLIDHAPQEFKVGMPFLPQQAKALRQALSEAATTIACMPATYITDPATQKQVFLVTRGRPPAPPPGVITTEYLKSFGDFCIPMHLWKALVNYAIWVEPVIVVSIRKPLFRRGYDCL
jgi:SAM-dependent methyltransferase